MGSGEIPLRKIICFDTIPLTILLIVLPNGMTVTSDFKKYLVELER